MDALSHLNQSLLGRYALDREIGAGGMATVYLARDIRHNRRVALKVLNQELGAVLGVERFLSEIQVTANLQHPNLLPLFDSGEADGLLFYVMPFVDGESLRAKLSREKQLPIDEAVHLATAIASALDYAHRHGVIHRDLKPENILLHEGQPLIADFGIALAVSNAGGSRITQTGLSLGTPQYMSPEQATGDRVIDGRTDIYSLGAVLYEALTGEPPHTGSTAQAIIARLLTEKPRPVRAARDKVPAHVEMTIDRALAKLPADRWLTASEFADALAGKHAGSLTTTDSSAGALHVEPGDGGARTIGRLKIGLGVAAVTPPTAVAIAGWALRSSARDARPVGPMRFTLLADQSTLAAGSASRTIAISPDGRTIVVAGLAANGSRQLIVRALDDIHPRLLAGSEGANQAFFSPDGKWLGFATALQLKKMPIGGGTPVVLAEIPAGMFGGAWLPNDQIIVATGGLLALVPATGGTPRPFTKLDSASREASQRWPYVLDSKTVLYTSWRASVGTSRVGIASLETGKAVAFDFPGTTPLGLVDGHLIYVGTTGSLMAVAFDMKRLRPSGAPPISLPDQAGVSILGAANAALSPTGSLVYQSESATWQLMLADAHGSVKPLLTERRAFAYPRFSPDGKHVAVAVDAAGRADIWVYSVADGTLSRLTTAGSTNDRPEWSPDSKRVLYRSDRGARSSIWWQPADGSGPEEPLLQMPNVDVWEAVLSPDGRTIVYRTGTTNESDIWYRRLDGDTTPKPIANSRFLEWNARLSSDGRWVAYASMESGNYQVYVRPFPGLGARYQVSAEGGLSPVWSRDGRRLYYTNGPQLVVANLTYTPTFHVTSRSHALDGDFPMVNQGHAGFDVSPTDERVLMLTPVAGNAQMVVAINWLDEVRALLAGKSR